MATRCEPWTDKAENPSSTNIEALRDRAAGLLLDLFDEARERARVYRRLSGSYAKHKTKTMDAFAAHADKLLNQLDDEQCEKALNQNLIAARAGLMMVRLFRDEDRGRPFRSSRHGDAA